ncbi:hypothetical protein BaRGS_00034168 [Batillaria attramentaria]|uniref:Uncharacterized protein n=1 Tax=Batillaria attramentaria TaxID=370345 RepID=A0ABD0JIC2_9CAEN
MIRHDNTLTSSYCYLSSENSTLTFRLYFLSSTLSSIIHTLTGHTRTPEITGQPVFSIQNPSSVIVRPGNPVMSFPPNSDPETLYKGLTTKAQLTVCCNGYVAIEMSFPRLEIQILKERMRLTMTEQMLFLTDFSW